MPAKTEEGNPDITRASAFEGIRQESERQQPTFRNTAKTRRPITTVSTLHPPLTPKSRFSSPGVYRWREGRVAGIQGDKGS